MTAALGLGTVQFGLPYGVSNNNGKPDEDEVRRVLVAASAVGVQVLDTAPSYGDSEAVLGRALPAQHRFRIITKTAAGTAANAEAVGAAVRRSVSESLQRLRCERIDGLLVHHASELLGPHGPFLLAALREEKALGRVRAIGVSVYDGEQIDRLMDVFRPDIVQIPLNVLDQRLLRSGHLSALSAAGIEVHARSVFLQGLLLMDPAEVPANLSGARPYLNEFRASAKAEGISLLAAALGFVASLPQVSVVLAGVTSLAELQQLSVAWRRRKAVSSMLGEPPHQILDPRAWPRA